ncbi:MAG: response regulator transcription factor [Pyrinomonadaceae bacterium]|nr:response regulator transcription factor [Pyrinomonadaceae bacterium]
MKTDENITVLLVDDHSIVRKGVRGFLEIQENIEVIGEAESGEKAVVLCEEFAPDVVLLDLLMSGMNGVETTRQIKIISPRSNVIILTSFHDNEYILPAIQAGALSYLLKDVSPNDLVQAVYKAAIGEAVLHPRIAAQIMSEMRIAKETKLNLDELTTRESEVLRLIAEGLSNSEIGNRLFISEKTVKSHVSNILSKLHLADRTKVAVYAWRSGIVK